MKCIVISLGGSVILSQGLEDSYFKNLAALLKKLSNKYKLYIITGGGEVARKYIKLGRELGFREEILDLLGIDVTRINARFLNNILGNNEKNIPCTIDEASSSDKSIVVMGGTTPGHSTDMVGAELAEKTHANLFIIATNVDGIFDMDPNKHHGAKLIPEINIEELINSFGTDWNNAGKNIVVDGPALKIIKRANLNTIVLNGKKLDQVENAIKSQPFEGTRIIL